MFKVSKPKQPKQGGYRSPVEELRNIGRVSSRARYFPYAIGGIIAAAVIGAGAILYTSTNVFRSIGNIGPGKEEYKAMYSRAEKIAEKYDSQPGLSKEDTRKWYEEMGLLKSADVIPPYSALEEYVNEHPN